MPAVQHLTAQAPSPRRDSTVLAHSRALRDSSHHSLARRFPLFPLALSSRASSARPALLSHHSSFHRAQERADVSSFLRAHAKDLSRACGTDKELAAFVDSFRRRWYWPF